MHEIKLSWCDNKTHIRISCSCGERGWKFRPEKGYGPALVSDWQSEHARTLIQAI